MKKLGKLMFCIATLMRVLSLVRFAVNVIQVKRDANGLVLFPYVKRQRTGAAQILAYHRVNDESDPFFPAVPTKVFNAQMEYVAENYTVWPLGAVIQALRSRDIPDNALAITFDDGYRDNYSNAFPILKKLKLPVTIFLATGSVGSNQCLWHDRVFSAFRQSRVPVLKTFGPDGRSLPLGSLTEKLVALNEVLKYLWSVNDDEKSACIDRLARQLGVTVEPDGESLMLEWENIRDMSAQGVGFGSHTVSHAILSKVSPARAKREIEESKKIIEDHLRLPVKHFAYPIGRREDLSQPTKRMLCDAGYECAVTSIFGSNHCGQDVFELRRATPWDQDIDSFALRLSYFKFVS